jgi:hypothetical protein
MHDDFFICLIPDLTRLREVFCVFLFVDSNKVPPERRIHRSQKPYKCYFGVVSVEVYKFCKTRHLAGNQSKQIRIPGQEHY